jgi:hypothetical protein
MKDKQQMMRDRKVKQQCRIALVWRARWAVPFGRNKATAFHIPVFHEPRDVRVSRTHIEALRKERMDRLTASLNKGSQR